VAVAERKTTSAVVIAGREINDSGTALRIGSIGLSSKRSIVDAVGVFIDQQECFDGQDDDGSFVLGAPSA